MISMNSSKTKSPRKYDKNRRGYKICWPKKAYHLLYLAKIVGVKTKKALIRQKTTLRVQFQKRTGKRIKNCRK